MILLRIFLYAMLILTLLSGCVFGTGNVTKGDLWEERQIKRIRPGLTSQMELMRILGPPVAIARQGQSIVFPPPEKGGDGSIEIESDTFFELFRDRMEFKREHVIYYYFRVEGRINTVNFFDISVKSSFRERIDRLWVLVDERSRLVEHFILLRGK